MRIAFIGFGEAARAYVASLRANGDLSFSAYDILLATAEEAPVATAAARLGVALAANAQDAVRGCDLVISAVTASQSVKAAQSVRDALVQGQVYIDINSVSSDRKTETANLLGQAGACYIDMAVMGPVRPRGHRTRALVAGPLDQSHLEMMKALGFEFEFVGPKIGAAAAIKLVRSLFVKGLEAVTVQALLAAEKADCFERVYDSLVTSFPGLDWPDFPKYQMERVATHGIRRAAEMRESASMMKDLGFAAGYRLADAIADLQQEIGDLDLNLTRDIDLSGALKAVSDARKERASP